MDKPLLAPKSDASDASSSKRLPYCRSNFRPSGLQALLLCELLPKTVGYIHIYIHTYIHVPRYTISAGRATKAKMVPHIATQRIGLIRLHKLAIYR